MKMYLLFLLMLVHLRILFEILQKKTEAQQIISKARAKTIVSILSLKIYSPNFNWTSRVSSPGKHQRVRSESH